jgi:hypothetical protein
VPIFNQSFKRITAQEVAVTSFGTRLRPVNPTVTLEGSALVRIRPLCV